MRALIREIRLHQRDAILDVGDAFEFLRAGTAHHAIDVVTFFQQELCKI
jgi:hypothetical protein